MTDNLLLMGDENPENNTNVAKEITMMVGKALIAAYPGRNWVVDPNIPGGIVTVYLAPLTGSYGFVIHLSKLNHDLEKTVVWAGGEILERFGLNRNRVVAGDTKGFLVDSRGEALCAKDGGI
jgi:hypothetical protein